MIYKKIKPNISFAKEDVDMIKIALKRQGGMGIKRASELYEALDFHRISSLASERRGYWKTWRDMGTEAGIPKNYVQCSSCARVIRAYGVTQVGKLPKFCEYCGSFNTIALRPSEYYYSLSYSHSGVEDEVRIKREAMMDEVKKYIEKSDFDITDYVFSTEEKDFFNIEVLEAFEQFVDQEDIPLFDEKGGVVYG